MDASRLASSPIGRLVPISGWDPRYNEQYSHHAYLPNPLPIKLDLEPDTYRAVTAATAAVARLDQASVRLPNPRLLARLSIRQEAVSTSALEGTYAALDDVLEADFLNRGQLSSSVAEVLNYVEAAEQAFEWIAQAPITVGLLCQLQKVLVRGTRGDTVEAGNLRLSQVFIGASEVRIKDARFVPSPPGDQLRAGLEAWAEWIRATNDDPLLVKIAAGHYQFETLHPFNDGNGRLGRLVCILQLMAGGELRVPVLNISPWLETRRHEYQDHLLQVSETGDFNPWIRFFCEAVRVQAVRAVERIDALLDWRDRALNTLRANNVRGLAERITEELIGFPMITPSDTASRHGVTYPGANNAIANLARLGILKERTGRAYARVFAAPDVLRIINEP